MERTRRGPRCEARPTLAAPHGPARHDGNREQGDPSCTASTPTHGLAFPCSSAADFVSDRTGSARLAAGLSSSPSSEFPLSLSTPTPSQRWSLSSMPVSTQSPLRLAACMSLNFIRVCTVVALLVGAAAQLVTLATNLSQNRAAGSDGYYSDTDIPTVSGGASGFALTHVLFCKPGLCTPFPLLC